MTGSRLNINGKIPGDLQETGDLFARARNFGDALWESIRFSDAQAPLIAGHYQRLSEGLAELGMPAPTHWGPDFFEDQIRKMNWRNARIRLTAARSPGGLYLPETDSPVFLLEAAPLPDLPWLSPLPPPISLGYCDRFPVFPDLLSRFKNPNALRYVLAAREAARQGWDAVLLPNTHGRLCSAGIGNLFWWEGETLCTIPVQEGCLQGVMRSVILRFAREFGLAVQEKALTLAALFEGVDEAFVSNAVRGIVPVNQLQNKKLEHGKTTQFARALHTKLAH